ncbi:MAG: hypothetical protein ACLRNW_28470 [Neglectibacter sp.]
MTIEISQEYLTDIIELLSALQARLEAEAAAYAALGKAGREIAMERLRAARETEKIQDYFLHL